MKVLTEPGVLPRSERFFTTPSAAARRVFLYVTRCGHYYQDERYDFRYTCDIGQEESHRNYFLMFLRSGAMEFDAENVRLIGRAGQCALLDCRRPHRFHALVPTESLWVHFDGLGAATLFAEILSKNGGRHVLTLPARSRIESGLAEIVSSLRSGVPLREVDYSERLYHMLCTLLFPEQPEESGADSPIARAMAFIGAHLCEELPVERLAAEVHLSPAHFSRVFREQTGFSPHEYIVLHRIDEAKALLLGTRLSVGEIAYRVGYKSEVNFIASFRSKTGLSPTAFRKSPL